MAAIPPLPPHPNLASPVREERDGSPFPHQPEKALEVYDEAYRKNPHDASLISRIGQAYVKTHQYTKVRPCWGRQGRGGPAQQGRQRRVLGWEAGWEGRPP